MEKENKNKILYLVLAIVVIIGLVILLMIMFNRKTTTKSISKPAKVTKNVKEIKKEVKEVKEEIDDKEPRLEIKSNNNEFHAGNSGYFKLIYTNEKGKEKDVTQESEWASNNSKIFSIYNFPKNKKGFFIPQQIGKAEIYAEYNGIYTTFPVEVKPTLLELGCDVIPITRDLNKVETKSKDVITARVGEELEFIFTYMQSGTPYYTYEAFGDDGLKSNQPIFSFIYKKPGIKHVYLKTTDFTGQTAEADCPIIKVVQ